MLEKLVHQAYDAQTNKRGILKMKSKLTEDIYNISRLGLAGKTEDLEMYVRRISQKIKNTDPDTSDKLSSLIRKSNNKSIVRDSMPNIPVDTDTRLPLLKEEDPVILNEPIFDEHTKEQIESIIIQNQKQECFIKEGLYPARSVLLTGPPGVGKTLAAKLIAYKLQLPLLTLDLSSVMSSFLGKTGSNVRNVIDYAKASNSILFLDEFDAIAKSRDDNTELGELKRLVTVLLQEIDNWPPRKLLLAATNHPKILDSAVWRRFDSIIEFTLPDKGHIDQAITQYFEFKQLKPEQRSILAYIFEGSSYSSIEKSILQIRRNSIIHAQPLEETITKFIMFKFSNMESKNKIHIANKMIKGGLSQRSVNKITGVSRDTIRKYSEGVK